MNIGTKRSLRLAGAAAGLAAIVIMILYLFTKSSPSIAGPNWRNNVERSPMGADASAPDEDQGLPRKITRPAAAVIHMPLGAFQFMQLDPIDDQTGNLTQELFETLIFTQSESSAVNLSFAPFFDRFLAIEADHSKLAETKEEAFIAVNSCADDAAALFSKLEADWSPILGADRAAAVCTLVKNELRQGGTQPMEVGFVITDEAGNGAINLRGGKSGQTQFPGRFDQFARWKVLSARFFSNREP